MKKPRPAIRLDSPEIAVIFSLFIFVSLLMFTVGILVGKGLTQAKYEGKLPSLESAHHGQSTHSKTSAADEDTHAEEESSPAPSAQTTTTAKYAPQSSKSKPKQALDLIPLRDKGWKVSGVEESPGAISFARRYYQLNYLQDLKSVKSGSMGVVRISHVLEHIPSPRSFLSELNRVLEPGGVLSVIVPNREPLCASLVNLFRSLLLKNPSLAGAIYPDMHVLGFSTKSLSSLLSQEGFELEGIKTVSMGNRAYFPMFYDGILNIEKTVGLKQFVRYWLPMLLDNLGNPFHRGQWIVAHFRKETRSKPRLRVAG